MNRPQILPVILSGGSGTRLWPLSRTGRPKQLLNLVGAQSMLQQTLARGTGDPRFAAPIIVANARHRADIEAQLAESRIAAGALILEPAARNTAPAIALAAHLAVAAMPDAVLLVMPSDHLIADPAAFAAAIDAALPLVSVDGWMATFGITPTGPETGYGYIRRGAVLADGVFAVERFVEKPDLATAKAYVADGNHAWNGGIFLMRADRYLDALARLAPAIFEATRAAMTGAARDGAVITPDAAAFAASPSDSIDYAVMEHADRVAVAPVAMGWSDIGSWDALWAVSPKDAEGNALCGDVRAFDSRGCLLRSDGPLLAAIGVEDLAVIATHDAVAILPRDRAQDIKRLVDSLAADQRPELDQPAGEAGPWGQSRQGLSGPGGSVTEHVIAAGAQRTLPRGVARELLVIDGTARIAARACPAGTRMTLAADEEASVVAEGGVLKLLEIRMPSPAID